MNIEYITNFERWKCNYVVTHLGLVSHTCVVKNSSHFPGGAYMRRKSMECHRGQNPMIMELHNHLCSSIVIYGAP